MNTTQRIDREKLKRSFKDLTAEEILDTYKHNTNNAESAKSKNKKLLLTEYIKKDILKPALKSSSTDEDLDNLDMHNPE